MRGRLRYSTVMWSLNYQYLKTYNARENTHLTDMKEKMPSFVVEEDNKYLVRYSTVMWFLKYQYFKKYNARETTHLTDMKEKMLSFCSWNARCDTVTDLSCFLCHEKQKLFFKRMV